MTTTLGRPRALVALLGLALMLSACEGADLGPLVGQDGGGPPPPAGSEEPVADPPAPDLPVANPPPSEPEPEPDAPPVGDGGGPATPATPVGSVGNDGGATVPAEAGQVDTSSPDHVVGDGSAASCTADAFRGAVAQGGVVTFDCGPAPVTITLSAPARAPRPADPTAARVVIDGGNTVTLSGGGQSRIIETEEDCYYDRVADQAGRRWCRREPRIVLQNLTMTDGDASVPGSAGGGAVFSSGYQVVVNHVRFSDNRCVATGADPGGAAIRVIGTQVGVRNYIVDSSFEGGSCSNGGAVSGLHADFAIYNSRFTDNEAIGRGQNHPDPAGGTAGVGLEGQPGGGLGGALYMDGTRLDLVIEGSHFEDNRCTELGGAVFYVSNDVQGRAAIAGSTFVDNPAQVQDGWNQTPGLYIQGIAGLPNRDLNATEIAQIISGTTLG